MPDGEHGVGARRREGAALLAGHGEAVEAIAVGTVGIVVAGGTESMSGAPYLLKGARWGYRLGHAEVVAMLVGRGADRSLQDKTGKTALDLAADPNVRRALTVR